LSNANRFGDLRRSTLSWCRRTRISASNAARDLNSPIKAHQINLQRSLIGSEYQPIRSCSQRFWVCGRDNPSNRLANVRDLKPNEPVNVAYPDQEAPGVLLKLGKRVPTGVGPDGDIVGFSTICPHKGFPLNYSKSDHTLNCPGHYSRFDCDAGGQQIWGQATQNLPQYMLRVDTNGDIYAEGLDELLYGRLSNVL
jgi:arsenite oxidase small subunit